MPGDKPKFITAEDVVKRIAAECAYVDGRGAVGIRLKPASTIVRQYGEQFRQPPPRRPKDRPAPLLLPVAGGQPKKPQP
jgi:hypothetical protein